MPAHSRPSSAARPRRLLALGLLGCCSQGALADSRETLVELPAIEVTTATRTARDIRTTPAPAQLIDRADIETSGAATLRGVLEQSPGLYVSPNGGSVRIRGLGQSDTLYLLDGRRIDGEFTNSFELERIPASQIERIEIIRGPASVLYGADALGGVINIITRAPETGWGGQVETQVGANDQGDAGRAALSANLNAGSERLRLSVHASHFERDPYAEFESAPVTVPNAGVKVPPSTHPNPGVRQIQDSYGVDVQYRDEARVDTLGARLEWLATPALRLALDVDLMREEREASYLSSQYPTAYLAKGKPLGASNIPARQFDDNQRLDAAATLSWSPFETLDLRYRLHYSRYDKDREVRAIPYADLGYTSAQASASATNDSALTQWVNDLTATWRPAPGHTLVGGIEHRDNRIDSEALKAEARIFESVFLQHEWQLLPALNLVYGARYDDDSVGGSRTSLQLGGVWTFSPLARLRANFAQGFKAPDDRSLYVDQVNPQGIAMLGAEIVAPERGKNEAHALDPESSDTLELGLAGGGSQWDYGITVFRTEVEDRIELVREISNGLSYNTFRNIGEARIQGIEAEAAVNLTRDLRARASFSRLEAENRTTGEPLLDTPETLASLTLDYLPHAEWMLQARLSYTGEQEVLGASGVEKADAYSLVSVRASYLPTALDSLEIHGGIDNLLDAEVDTLLGSNPGPYAYLGIRYGF